MQKLILIFVIGILTFSLGGCGSPEEAEETETIEETTPTETEGGTEEGEEGEEEQSQLEEFEDPLVEEKQKEQAAAEAGLIQSTKAEERLLQLKGSSNGTPQPQARASDPFSVLPPLVVQGTPDEEEAAEAVASSVELNARQVPELPALPVAAAPPPWRTAEVVVATTPGEQTGTGNNQTAQGRTGTDTGNNQTAQGRTGTDTGNNQTAQGRTGTGTDNNQTAQPSQPEVATPLPPAQIPAIPQLPSPPTPPPLQVATIPELPNLPPSESPVAWVDPNPPVIAEPPPPPSTTLAEAIAVTGVVRTGNQTRVILKAPTEPTSRYVTVGQTVANGEVLVKRVKFSQESDPIVIFEQNGVEVARVVGSGSQTQEELNLTVPPPPTINAFNKV